MRAALATLPDVRRAQGKVHPLDAMLALAVCALLCGSRSLYAISQWGRECEPENFFASGIIAPFPMKSDLSSLGLPARSAGRQEKENRKCSFDRS